jgi:O-antigen/teichoic acid export membrane protein
MSIAIPEPNQAHSEAEAKLAADSLVSGLSFMLVANVLQRAVGFIRNIVLCGFLTDNQLGMWALASSFFVLAAPLAVLGLPGTFGRMVESYRSSGQLNLFLKRTGLFSLLGVLTCCLWLVLDSQGSSSLIFGDALSRATMITIALALCAVILFNTLTELLSGLRKARVVSAMHTCNSLVFTVASLGGLWVYNDWRVLVVAFAIAALAGVLPALPILRDWKSVEASNVSQLPARDMWSRVLPFAFSIWCMNLLTNLFDVIDRYMLLYLASESAEQGRALVGQFHSGRIMPVLLSSLTFMISGILLPYLASDWEAGRRKQVADGMRLAFKFGTLFFMSLSVASLAVAPFLFNTILHGKYSDGLSIMPQAMLHCCFAAIAFLMQNYFWCAEKGKTVGLIIAIGLLINVVLNLWLVPAYSLYGAMLATSIAGGAILAMTLLAMHRAGVPLGSASIWFCMLPITLAFGCVPASIALATTLVLISRTDWLLSAAEQRSIDDAILPRLERLGIVLPSLWFRTAR